jgi:hypothetical protein
MNWVTMRTSAGRQAIADEFLESYVSWRESCEAVSTSYQWWQACDAPQRGLAFESYLAALDREEIASQVHADRSERLRALNH